MSLLYIRDYNEQIYITKCMGLVYIMTTRGYCTLESTWHCTKYEPTRPGSTSEVSDVECSTWECSNQCQDGTVLYQRLRNYYISETSWDCSKKQNTWDCWTYDCSISETTRVWSISQTTWDWYIWYFIELFHFREAIGLLNFRDYMGLIYIIY